jgi:hypothetical protein
MEGSDACCELDATATALVLAVLDGNAEGADLPAAAGYAL